MVLSDAVLIAIVSACAAMVGAFIAMLPALVVAVRTQHKVTEVHALANSMKDELVRVTRSDALQEGRTVGITEEKVRASEAGPVRNTP